MKQIKALTEQASALHAKYNALNDAHSALRSELAAKHQESCDEEERQMEVLRQRQEKAVAKTKQEMEAAIQANQQLLEEVRAKLSQYEPYAPDAARNHTPKPEELNREDVAELCHKIDKNDLFSLVKRKLQIGGFRTKEDMARELIGRLVDAAAYCEKQIAQAKYQQPIDQLRAEAKYTKQISDQMVAWHDFHIKFDKAQKSKLAASQKKIQEFLDSRELKEFTDKVQQLQSRALADEGWNGYVRPQTLPQKIRLLNIRKSLALCAPDPKGSGMTFRLQETTLPVDLELFGNHVLVFTADAANAPGSDSIARLAAHRFMARLLKDLPPKTCRCALADLDGQGFNLSPLSPLEDKPQLNWSRITRPKQAASDRKAFLDFQNGVAQDLVITGKTFFEAARAEKELRHPLSWYADFSFPGNPDASLQADLNQMMKTAGFAGTSFLFVTNETGLAQIRKMAKSYPNLELIHIDCTAKCLRLGSDSYSLALGEIPDNTQIREFVRTVQC